MLCLISTNFFPQFVILYFSCFMDFSLLHTAVLAAPLFSLLSLSHTCSTTLTAMSGKPTGTSRITICTKCRLVESCKHPGIHHLIDLLPTVTAWHIGAAPSHMRSLQHTPGIRHSLIIRSRAITKSFTFKTEREK